MRIYADTQQASLQHTHTAGQFLSTHVDTADLYVGTFASGSYFGGQVNAQQASTGGVMPTEPYLRTFVDIQVPYSAGAYFGIQVDL